MIEQVFDKYTHDVKTLVAVCFVQASQPLSNVIVSYVADWGDFLTMLLRGESAFSHSLFGLDLVKPSR